MAEVICEQALNRLMVMPGEGLTIAGQVTRMVRDEGWEIEEVYVATGQLDEVFRRITTQGGSAGGGDLS